MTGFYDKLKSEKELDDEDIETIKGCFGKQKIKFSMLMEVGDLAITDGKLEKYGITQGGLRTAILAVIKKYQ